MNVNPPVVETVPKLVVALALNNDAVAAVAVSEAKLLPVLVSVKLPPPSRLSAFAVNAADCDTLPADVSVSVLPFVSTVASSVMLVPDSDVAPDEIAPPTLSAPPLLALSAPVVVTGPTLSAPVWLYVIVPVPVVLVSVAMLLPLLVSV